MAVLATIAQVKQAIVGVPLSADWVDTAPPAGSLYAIDDRIVKAHAIVQMLTGIDMSAWTTASSVYLSNLEAQLTVAIIKAEIAGDPTFTIGDSSYKKVREQLEKELLEIRKGKRHYDFDGALTIRSMILVPDNEKVDLIVKTIKEGDLY